MTANINGGAAAPGPVTPTSDEAQAVAAAQGFRDDQFPSPDFPCCGVSTQAALSIEGEDYAREYLARLHGGIAEPGELAVIVAFLTGEMLHGACRLIERALGVPHA